MNAIPVKDGIAADERKALAQRLRGQQAIEWVLMMQWEILYRYACSDCNIKQENAALDKIIPDS